MPRSFAERYKADKRRRKRKRSGLACGLMVVAITLCWSLVAMATIKVVILPIVKAADSQPPPEKKTRDENLRGLSTTWSKATEFVPNVVEPTIAKEPEVEYELDPRTGLMVPTFWRPPLGQELESTMDMVDGHPTIWLMVASYRDFQCPETVASALSRAEVPTRLKISIVEQNAPGDVPCDCQNNTSILCQYASQIWVYKMDSTKASGPVYARHIGTRMYRGEAFAMQIDAHVQFVRAWDTSLIEQWRATGNEMAVLSTYLTDVQESIDADGRSRRNTRPIMCNSDFEGRPPARYLRHNAQPEEVPAIQGTPMMQPFWAAGFSFARGHFVHRVPYDCCLPMVFMGEEISIGIRAWTHGYDMYTPEHSVVFHEYAQKSSRRHKVHFFWENKGRSNADSMASLKRLTALIGMAPDVVDFDSTDADKYGLGTVRQVDEFYRIFMVDVIKRQAKPLCKFVKSGVMHRDFSAKLRPDGRGVDYALLAEYDTTTAIVRELDLNWRPRAIQAIERAIEKNAVGWLQNAINLANRAELRDVKPDLMQRAEAALRALQPQ